MTTIYILTLACDDRPGIVKSLATGIGSCGGNILASAQYSDPVTDRFVMRVEFETAEPELAVVTRAVKSEVDHLEPTLTVRPSTRLRRMVIMVSKFDHCLRDLLNRWEVGELGVEIPVVISNHEDCRALVESYGIPFAHIPVTPETKVDAEAEVMRMVDEHDVDYVVLARYMQVLSDRACRSLNGRIVNIHHSFLPGFKGAKPYHQAYDRGVKLIGATAHFVTADLDEGPIIEQDVERVTHAQTVEQLVTLGRDIERVVLSRAVGMLADDRVFMLGHRTVVFPR